MFYGELFDPNVKSDHPWVKPAIWVGSTIVLFELPHNKPKRAVNYKGLVELEME